MSNPYLLKPPGSSASNVVSTSKSADNRSRKGKESRSNSSVARSANSPPILSRNVVRTVPPWVSSEELAITYSPPPGAPGASGTSKDANPAPPEQTSPTRPVPPGSQLPTPPKPAVAPTHNHTPADNNANLQHRVSHDGYEHWDNPDPKPHWNVRELRRRIGLGRSTQGRKWDHKRSAEPVIVLDHGLTDNWQTDRGHMKWTQFARSTDYPRIQPSSQVDISVLNELQPTFNSPATMPPYDSLNEHGRPRALSITPPGTGIGGSNMNSHQSSPTQLPYMPYDSEKYVEKRSWRECAWEMLLNHYMVPLLCRLMALSSSAISMAVAARIYRVSGQIMASTETSQSQALVVIIIDTIAVPYICYMTYDEYTGKPLGLRSPTHKVMLLLLDLIFIIFKSASTSLAFEYLVSHANDPNSDGFNDPKGPELLRLSRALAAFVVLGLFAWTSTLVINVLRTVNRLSTSKPVSRGYVSRSPV